MLKFTGTLFEIGFNKTQFGGELQKAMARVQRFAAKAWLRKVYPAVIVWTGQSRATLQPLARFLNFKASANPLDIHPVAFRAKRGEAIGDELGQDAYSFKSDKEQQIFRFEIKDLAWQINEFYNANEFSPEGAAERGGKTHTGFHLKHPGPYLAIQKGRVAYYNIVQTTAPKACPRITDYIRYSVLVLRGRLVQGSLSSEGGLSKTVLEKFETGGFSDAF